MTDNICAQIKNLINYGITCGLIESEDTVYIRNSLLDLLGRSTYTEQESDDSPLEVILEALSLYAQEHRLIDDLPSSRERFETALMGTLTPRPSDVIRRFNAELLKKPENATTYFYELCQNSNYISRYHTARDLKWTVATEYGELEITINLSKPEKDPRDIAKAKSNPGGGYPNCLLCAENEGYAGNPSHPARHNLRIIPIKLDGQDWGFQYSPYVYYDEHCILINTEHTPMVINRAAFRKLLSFVGQYPHYFAGSNADIPIVGGSILSHEHFQGGRHRFPMEAAGVDFRFGIRGYAGVDAGIVKWPLTVLRISHESAEILTDCAVHILDTWRGYSDERVFIRAHTGGTPHNAITPIARMRDGKFELDLVLRNNITTEERPYGVYHPREELHHIKKENIGLIEVMGLAVLPSRLEREMRLLERVVLEGGNLSAQPETAKHETWYRSWSGAYGINRDNIGEILRVEMGRAFKEVLEDAGVFKRDEEGRKALRRFIETLSPKPVTTS